MSVHRLLEDWLGSCAARTIRREQPTIIAITGSVGKSSTRNAIGYALSAQDPNERVRVSYKNFNNELGVPFTIFGIQEYPGSSPLRWLSVLWRSFVYGFGLKQTGIKTFVLEMGADHPGDLAKLTKIAPPDVTVITAVTPEDSAMAPVHTANYSSIDAVAEEKATLVKATKPNGVVILNADDARVFAMRHVSPARVYLFGESDASDVRLVSTHIRTEASEYGQAPVGLEITLESFNRLRKFFLPGIFGRSIAYALCAAMTVAAIFDTGLGFIDTLTQSFSGLPGRTRIIPGIRHTILFDDSYNASPVAVFSALRDLASVNLESHQRRVACLGEMRELGEQSKQLHYQVGVEAARLKLDLLICCGTLAHAMADGARAAGMSDEHVKIFDDTPETGRFLQDWIRPGDVILAKASEGPTPSSPNWGKVTGVRMERVTKELMADPTQAEKLLVRQYDGWIK